jgi:hypothetical protein
MRAGVRFLVIATPPGWRIDDRQAPLKTPSVERLHGTCKAFVVAALLLGVFQETGFLPIGDTDR